jgi:colicin import membrane protein
MAFPLIPLISVGLQAAGSIFSFQQAKESREKEKNAQAAAAKAMAEAKAELEVNRLRGLSIAKEPYELEREAIAQAGASALQAGVEGDPRGAAATAGRVLQAQQRALGQQRAAMSKEMADLERLAAMEDTRLQRARAEIDLGEAFGQQVAEREARMQAAQQTQAGIGMGLQALTGLGGVLPQIFPGKSGDAGAGFDPFTGFTSEDLMGVGGITPPGMGSYGMPGGFGSDIPYTPIFPKVPAVPNL